MKPVRLLIALSALLVLGLLPPVAAEGDESLYPSEPTVIGTQAALTFGDDPEVAALGTALGADLREARISMPDADTLLFEIQVEELPPVGGTPEAIRYTWDLFFVNEGEKPVEAQLDGKFSNYSRGTCDPTSGQCDPQAGKMPRDPGQRPFFFRGNLTQLDLTATTFNAMEELDVIEAEFDVAEATIRVAVPIESVNLLDGFEWDQCTSRITNGTGIFGGTVETAPSAFVSYGSFPSDTIFGVTAFEPPRPASCTDLDA